MILAYAAHFCCNRHDRYFMIFFLKFGQACALRLYKRIFYLLGFKKSLFSGTLDGEKDTVKLDEKSMGSFMETVERLTEANTEKAHAEDTTKTETRRTLRTTEEEKDDSEIHCLCPECGNVGYISE